MQPLVSIKYFLIWLFEQTTVLHYLLFCMPNYQSISHTEMKLCRYTLLPSLYGSVPCLLSLTETEDERPFVFGRSLPLSWAKSKKRREIKGERKREGGGESCHVDLVWLPGLGGGECWGEGGLALRKQAPHARGTREHRHTVRLAETQTGRRTEAEKRKVCVCVCVCVCRCLKGKRGATTGNISRGLVTTRVYYVLQRLIKKYL